MAWAAGAAFVVILALTALVTLVNTDGVHRYLLGLAQRKAGEALGVRVHLEDFTLHPGSLSLDLYGVRVSGARPYQDPPLLRADHIGLSVRVISVFGRKWYFNKIQIDHPVAWIVVDQKGASNLPVFKSSGSSHPSIFEIGIRNVAIDRGEVYYNSRPSAIAASLHDLEFSSTFNALLQRYAGRLSYGKGDITYGSFRPLLHAFDSEFEATPNSFKLNSARISSGASQAVISAALQNYASPKVQAQYQIVLNGEQAAQILREPSMPDGSIRASGSLKYQQSANRSAIEMLQIEGDLSSTRLTFRTSSVHGDVTNVLGHYSLANGNAVLRDLRANLLGGVLSASGKIEAIGGKSHSSFEGKLQQLSLADARQAFTGAANAKDIELNGQANATAKAEWGKSMDDLVARADLFLDGHANRSQTGLQKAVQPANAGSNPGDWTMVPIHGEFHTIYSNSQHELTFNNSSLRSSQSNLSLNGAVGPNCSLSVNLQANDLSEIATFANLFSARAEGGSQLDLTGQASFQGVVRGSTVAPDVMGNLTAQEPGVQRCAVDLVANGSRAKSVQVPAAEHSRASRQSRANLGKCQRGTSRLVVQSAGSHSVGAQRITTRAGYTRKAQRAADPCHRNVEFERAHSRTGEQPQREWGSFTA